MILLNGIAYILPKLMKLERVIKYWNKIEDDEIIGVIFFKEDIVIRTYRKAGVIDKFIEIKK